MTYTTGLSLIEIITENEASPKAIIMAGGAGAGKSHLRKKLNLSGLALFDPDRYTEDTDHPYYNNLGAASRQVEKDVLATAEAKNKISFIWDTTASGKNFDNHLDNLLSSGYDIYMVMVYTHPMISYASNFKRKRNVPASAVFQTWRNAYRKIEHFRNKLKGNLSIFVNNRGGGYDKEVQAFNNAAKKGVEGIKSYLKAYNEKTGAGKSTFFKPVEMTREEEQAFEEAVINVDFNRENRSEDKAIKKEFLKSYKKIGSGPGEDKLRDVVKKHREEKVKEEKDNDEVLASIAGMLFNSTFQDLLQHSSVEEIDDKIQNFLR